MRNITLAASLTFVLAEASGSSYTPNMTGDLFVEHLRHSDPTTPLDYRKRDMAYSYVEGVKDATVGKTWCDRHTVKTPDRAYDLADAIAAMGAKARTGNAAILIAQYLKRRFPCRQRLGSGVQIRRIDPRF